MDRTRHARVGFERELSPGRFTDPASKTLPSLAGASGGDPPRRPSGKDQGKTGHYAPDVSPTFKPLPIRLSAPPLPSQPSRTTGPIVMLGGDAFDTSEKRTPSPVPPPRPGTPLLILGGEALDPPSPRSALFAPFPAPPQRPLVMLGGEAYDTPPPLRRARTI